MKASSRPDRLIALVSKKQPLYEKPTGKNCENGLDGTLDFYEVKRDASRFDRGKLEEKIAAFFSKHPSKRSARRLVAGLSMADM